MQYKRILLWLFVVSCVVLVGLSTILYFFPNLIDIPTRFFPTPSKTATIENATLQNGYPLSFTNPHEFNSRLEDLGFYSTQGVGVHDGQQIAWQSAHTLTIRFSEQKQFWPAIFSGKTKTELSTFHFAVDKKGNATLTLWIDPAEVQDLDRFSLLVNRTVFIALYKVTHWSGDSDEAYLQYLIQLNEDLSATDLSERPIAPKL